LSIGNIVGISALMHMDKTLKGTNVEFNKNTKQKIIKINSGYFWVPPRTYIKIHRQKDGILKITYSFLVELKTHKSINISGSTCP
jgi:hypothetical protein